MLFLDLVHRYEDDPELNRISRQIRRELISATDEALCVLARLPFAILAGLIRAGLRGEEDCLKLSRDRIVDDP